MDQSTPQQPSRKKTILSLTILAVSYTHLTLPTTVPV